MRSTWRIEIMVLSPGVRGGGGYLLTTFNTGRLRPEVQPLSLLYTILPYLKILFINPGYLLTLLLGLPWQ